MKKNRWEILPQELFQGLKMILMITFGGIAFMFGALKWQKQNFKTVSSLVRSLG